MIAYGSVPPVSLALAAPLDAVPAQRLLRGLEQDFDRIQVVGVARLFRRRQAREGGGATGQ